MIKINKGHFRTFTCPDCGEVVYTRSANTKRCPACASLKIALYSLQHNRQNRLSRRENHQCPLCGGERDTENIYCSYCTRVYKKEGIDPGPEPFHIAASWNGRPYRRA